MPTDDLTRDALAYLEALFAGRPDPSVIVVTARNGKGLGPSRFPLSPQDALPLVLGAVDTYVRITPLAHKPERGRGSAADAVSLPGVWAEIDVNGTPNGKGGVKAGALPSFDAAVELAGCVLEPTMLVRSGGGVHAYHLLDEPLWIETDEDRERAARLVEGWQHRLRQEARERYGAGLDGTADLARVLRPVGSVNGKGDTPRPVELMDDGGRRYSLANIQDKNIAAPKVNVFKPADETASRSVKDLLELFPDVAKLVARKGKAPGDGSASAWDMACGCRAAERECSDNEITALIRESRRQHGEDKGQRDDYVERTLTAIRRRIPRATEGGDQLLAVLTKELHAQQVKLTVTGVEVSGYGDAARTTITLSDGSKVDFARLEHVANATRLGDVLSATAGISAEFTKLQARRIAAHIRRYVGRTNEGRDQEQATTWGVDFLRQVATQKFTFTDTVSRFVTWQQLTNHDPEHVVERVSEHTTRRAKVDGADAYARNCIVAVDTSTGKRYIPAGWFQEYVRRTSTGAKPQMVAGLMLHPDVGWERPGKEGRIKATGEPRPIVSAFYVVPKGWEDGREADE